MKRCGTRRRPGRSNLDRCFCGTCDTGCQNISTTPVDSGGLRCTRVDERASGNCQRVKPLRQKRRTISHLEKGPSKGSTPSLLRHAHSGMASKGTSRLRAMGSAHRPRHDSLCWPRVGAAAFGHSTAPSALGTTPFAGLEWERQPSSTPLRPAPSTRLPLLASSGSGSLRALHCAQRPRHELPSPPRLRPSPGRLENNLGTPT